MTHTSLNALGVELRIVESLTAAGPVLVPEPAHVKGQSF